MARAQCDLIDSIRELKLTRTFQSAAVLSIPLPCRRSRRLWHYFHTPEETPETVPWTGLEASTRAYARIIDER